MALDSVNPTAIPTSVSNLAYNCPTESRSCFRIRFPGGALRFGFPGANSIPTPEQAISHALAQIDLTPLQPIFDVIEVLQAIVECIQAIPDAITAVDPQGVIDCIPNLLEELSDVLALLPPLSVPPMVEDILCFLNQVIEAAEGLLDLLIGYATDISELEDLASDIPAYASRLNELVQDLTCTQDGLTNSLGAMLGMIDPILAIINPMLKAIGQDEIPSLGSTVGISPEQVKDILAQFKQALGVIPATCLVNC